MFSAVRTAVQHTSWQPLNVEEEATVQVQLLAATQEVEGVYQQLFTLVVAGPTVP